LSLFTLTSSQAWRISYFFPKTVTKKKKKGGPDISLEKYKIFSVLGKAEAGGTRVRSQT
jgi:hypothetical protein